MKMTFAGALRKTLKEEMAYDDRIFLMGEDIGVYGGIFNVTLGLMDEFGEDRVIDTPLSECAIVGCGVGAAMAGLRPIVEIMYADFLPLAMDQIINSAAKASYLSCGKITVPLVIRSNFGAGKGDGAHHSQSPEGWFMNVPGLKIVVPSTPADARGLLKSSIRDNNPVLFLEHKLLYSMKGEINENDDVIPLGKADIKRDGTDLTIVSSAVMLHKSLKASEELKEDGIEVEVVDIRTVKPFDKDTICQSVRKTGRLLVVEESPYTGGWGAQVIETVLQSEFNSLKMCPQRLASLDIPLPADKSMEDKVVPNVNRIKEKIKEMLK